MKEKLCIMRKKITNNMVGQDAFFPVYNSDLNFMKKCKVDNPILCSSKRSRNYKHHKLIFAIAKCVLDNLKDGHIWENQTPYDLIKAIMMQECLFDLKLNLDGSFRHEIKSISFESMDQDQFDKVSDLIFKHGAELLEIEQHELEKNYLDYI